MAPAILPSPETPTQPVLGAASGLCGHSLHTGDRLLLLRATPEERPVGTIELALSGVSLGEDFLLLYLEQKWGLGSQHCLHVACSSLVPPYFTHT